MSSVAVQVMPSPSATFSKDSPIANKLASDLDAKLVSSSKQVLLQRIEFKPASKADEQYENLKKKYVPLNSQSSNYMNGSQAKLMRAEEKTNSNEELPSPKVVLFPWKNVQMSWKQVRRVGPGLNNMGNTCFLNSVLQVLTYTPPLVNYLASKEHSEKCRTVGFCMLCELQKHIIRTFSHHQGEAIKPLAIIQKLKFIAKHLRFGHQEDAHEFLRYVIDGIQKSCLAADGYTEKLDRMSKQTTMVHQVFGGYYRSQVRCLKCKNNSNTFDPLMDIMLDIKHLPSVEKALQRSVKMELLDGENLYMCPRCKRKVPAHKQFLIHRAPNILTLQLKRFDYNQIFGGKISKHVEYSEFLNLRPYMTSPGPPIKYRLYAVLVHSGYSSNSGHYYCYIRASNGVWYQMNDSIVRQVAMKAVLSQQAYLLFYTRISPSNETSKSPSLSSPTSTPKTPVLPKEHLPKVIQQNDVGTSVKPGIYFNRTPASTSTMPKPSTTPSTNHAPSVPLASSSQRPKFTFTIPVKSKGVKTDLNKAKTEEKELGEKSENIVGKDKVGSLLTGATRSEVKSPITSSEKKLEEAAELEAVRNVTAKPDVSNREKIKDSSENVPLRKEGKERSDSPSNKPRPPPLFIPRVVAQGKGTPLSAAKATTPWKVTPKTTSEPVFGPMSPPPRGTMPPQQSPSSAMSDTSSTSSVMGKTGEWTVTDKTVLTPGPRLPERQHAGWQVSRKSEDEKDEVGEDKVEEKTKTDEKGSEKKKKKKKHKKEKKKKKEKKEKKYERLEESDSSEEEKKKRKKKKDKNHRSDKVNQEPSSDEKSKSKKSKRKHYDEAVVSPSKRPCLVSYDDSSSSSGNELVSSGKENKKSEKGGSRESSRESRVPVIYDDAPKKKHSARRATWDGSRASSAVDQLLSSSKGFHGYGSSVTSWDGGENSVDNSVGEPGRKRQRRDSWDDEYDRGKEKKIKKNKDTSERHRKGNPFQQEHERRSSKQGFKDRFSRQLSKNHKSHHGHFRSHSSRKYRRMSS
ncbi:Ubiquitin carboxyl-terminal hydrolase 42 [Porites harrisoni]